MRNILNSAMEGFQQPGSNLMLSLEEEAELVAEATAEQAGLDNDLTEADRLSDMSDALEDLAVVADGIEGENGEGVPTDNEANLIDTVANASVAGTDVAPEEIVPALESHGGKRRYSAESIREKARSIWEAIKRILKQVWAKIESFIHKIFGTIPSLRRRIEDLKKRVQDNGRKTIEDKKITISSGVAALSANYKTPSNAAELEKNLKYLREICKATYVDDAETTLKVGEAVLDGINDFDPEKAKESAEDFLAKVSGAMKNASSGSPAKHAVSGNRFGEHVNAKLTDPILGNISIVEKEPTYVRHAPGNAPILGKLENLRGFGAEVVQTSEKPKDVPNNFEMSTASNTEMLNLCDESLEILEVLEKFQRGKKADEMKKLKTKLEVASTKATAAMDKANSKDEAEDKVAVPYYRAILNFNQAYARWVKDPALPMVGHSLASVRATVNVVQKSLSAYKTV